MGMSLASSQFCKKKKNQSLLQAPAAKSGYFSTPEVGVLKKRKDKALSASNLMTSFFYLKLWQNTSRSLLWRGRFLSLPK